MLAISFKVQLPCSKSSRLVSKQESGAGLQEPLSEAITEPLQNLTKKLFKNEFTPASELPGLCLLYLDFGVFCSFAANFDEDAPAFSY